MIAEATELAPRTFLDVDPGAVLAVFVTLAAAASAGAAVLAVRTRDAAPVLACLGALVCSLNEPIYDELGKIVYAADNVRAYTAFGRDIPLFLVLGYVPWVGLLPVLVSRMMARGVSRRRLHAIAFASFASVVVVETLGTRAGAWTYYGEPPLKYLGVAPQMAAVPIVCGFLLYAVGGARTGPARVLLFLVPTVALPAVYASAGWPMYVALHADVPRVVDIAAGLLTLMLCAAIVTATTSAARCRREVVAANLLPPPPTRGSA